MRRSRYLLKRSIGYLATIFLILLFNFVLIRVMPGDPMLYILGKRTTMISTTTIRSTW